MAVVAGRGVATGRPVSDVDSGRRNNDVSQREDLANFISMITRDETPFMSSIGKTKATAIFHEWQTDQLNAPGDSRITEGTDYVIPTGLTTGANGLPTTGLQANDVGQEFATTGPNRQRLGNYAQINGKTIAVSGTRRAIDQAGVADEYAYQLKKRGTELRRDLEHDMIHKYQVANGTATRRTFGGFQAWINDSLTCNVAGTGVTLPTSTAAVLTDTDAGTAGAAEGRATISAASSVTKRCIVTF